MARVHTGESQPLHRDGKVIRRADGTIFDYRAFSWFAAFHRFALGQMDDLEEQADDWVGLGYNSARVFALFDAHGIGKASGTGECSPRTVPNFYALWRMFVEWCAQRGIIVVAVYCADCDARSDGTGGLMTNPADVQAHIDRMDAALEGAWNVLRQGANEPFKNLEKVASYRFRRDGTQPLDFGIETVEFGASTMDAADWVGKHDHKRDDFEFPRDPRSIDELREGFDWVVNGVVVGHFNGTGTGVAADEPMGAAAFPRSGSRSSDPQKFRETAACARLMGMGSCFHSDDGIAARKLEPVQRACAEQWIVGATFAPVEAQLAGYQRGGFGGGAGVGNMPIEHHDLPEGKEPGALRSFCKLVNGREYCIRIAPVGATVPRDGWQIEKEDYLGLVVLTR